jgi:hypothetical protein
MLFKKIQSVIKNERGDFGIKQIAFTVAVILLIGFVVTLLKGGLLGTWINQIWTMLINFINNNIK